MNIVIPMAGLGSRFPKEIYKESKPMIPVGKNRETMIECAIESLGFDGLEASYFFIVNKEIYTDVVRILKEFMGVSYHVIPIDYITEGPASSVLIAKEFINNDKPLIVTNCDQIMEWNTLRFKKVIKDNNRTRKFDGIVVTYNVQTEKNSYVKVDDFGFATEFAEKKIISQDSLNGIHYWLRGSDFVYSAESMIKKNIRVNNEFYIAPTYNELVQIGKKIVPYRIRTDEHWAVGTPEDLQKYLEHANIQTS